MDITKWSIQKPDALYYSAVEDGEALYSQQKQDLELTVAQIISSYPIQASTEESGGNHWAI